MPQTHRFRLLLPILCALVLIVSATAVHAQSNEKIIWVAHYKADCVGVGPQKCYLIKDNMYDPWKLWYDEIERLDWEEGFAYEVVVVEEPIPDPPADAPSVRLRVVELLTMINAGSQPAAALPPELQDLPPQDRPVDPTLQSTGDVADRDSDLLEEEAVELEPTTGSTETTAPPQIETPIVTPVAPPAGPEEPTVDQQIEPGSEISEPAVSSPVAAPSDTSQRADGSATEAMSDPPAASQAAATPTLESSPTSPPAAVSEATMPDDRVPTYRGHLTIGVGLETRTFKICGAEDPIWIEDRSDGDLWMRYRELSGYPNRPMFLVVEGDLGPAPATGFGAHYEQQLIVTRIRQAATEGPGCEEQTGNLDFVAFGNEPFWQVRISPRGIVYSEAGGADWIFPYKEPMATDTRRVYWGTSADGSGHRIQVTIEEAPCSDTMADAQYSFTAAVTIDNRQLGGCARVGGP